PPDLAQVELERVERWLGAQVELRRRLRLVLNERWPVRRLLVLLPLGQVDRAFGQVGVELLDLLPRQLDLLERGRDLVVGQKPLLKAIGDEPRQLFGVRRSRSRPQLSTEPPGALRAFVLPLGDGEPGVRGLHHRKPDYSSPAS